MKTLDLFVVELESQMNDTIKTDGGLELYVDTKFNEFDYRVTEGPVVCAPLKYNTGVEEGDTLYFHHHVVLNDGQALTGDSNHYIVRFSPDYTHGNQAIAYKSKKDGVVRPMAGWALLEAAEEEDDARSEIIKVVVLNKDLPRRGVVSFDAPWLEEIDVKKGDVVGFRKNADYRITIDGKEYFRTRIEDLFYVEEEVHND